MSLYCQRCGDEKKTPFGERCKNCAHITSTNDERTKDILTLIKTKTLREIGEKYGITRERVRQILAREGIIIPKNMTKEVQCWLCPNTVKKPRFFDDSSFVICPNCYQYIRSRERVRGMKTHARHFEIGDCIRCGKRRGNRVGYCNACRVWKYKQDNPEYKKKSQDAINAKIKERYQKDPEFRKRLLASHKAYRDRLKNKLLAK